MTPRETPTPIPAASPAGRPLGGGCDVALGDSSEAEAPGVAVCEAVLAVVLKSDRSDDWYAIGIAGAKSVAILAVDVTEPLTRTIPYAPPTQIVPFAVKPLLRFWSASVSKQPLGIAYLAGHHVAKVREPPSTLKAVAT